MLRGQSLLLVGSDIQDMSLGLDKSEHYTFSIYFEFILPYRDTSDLALILAKRGHGGVAIRSLSTFHSYLAVSWRFCRQILLSQERRWTHFKRRSQRYHLLAPTGGDA